MYVCQFLFLLSFTKSTLRLIKTLRGISHYIFLWRYCQRPAKSSVVNRHYRFFRTDEQSVSACTDKKAGTDHENAIAGNLK